MKKLASIFIILLLIHCSNDKNPYSPAKKEGFFNSVLFPYLGRKDTSVVFMIYLNAANDLEICGVQDFYFEIKSADLLSANKEITIIVLMDRIIKDDPEYGYTSYDDWYGTRLYKITKNGAERLGGVTINNVTLTSFGDNEELNMGDPKTLEDFVKYCIKSYNADYYILDIWNHGDGWRYKTELPVLQITKEVSIDEESGNDSLRMNEVQQALENAVADAGKKIDVLYFDACLMQMVEVGYELKNAVKYIAASESVVPGYGGDYADIMERLKDMENPTPFNIGLEILNSYKEQYFDVSSTTFSIIDTSQIDSLIEALNTFSVNLTNESFSTISNARENSRSYFNVTNNVYLHVDLYSFAENVSSVNGANDVMDAIEQVVKKNYYCYMDQASYGIAIYFPNDPSFVYSYQVDYKKYQVDYTNQSNPAQIDFLDICKWRDFIRWYSSQ